MLKKKATTRAFFLPLFRKIRGIVPRGSKGDKVAVVAISRGTHFFRSSCPSLENTVARERDRCVRSSGSPRPTLVQTDHHPFHRSPFLGGDVSYFRFVRDPHPRHGWPTATLTFATGVFFLFLSSTRVSRFLTRSIS